MSALVRDVRTALRSVRAAPGLTATIVLTLALGIGANTALFTYVCAWLWPVVDAPRPEQLVSLEAHWKDLPYGLVSYADLLDIRRGQKVFEHLAGARPNGASLQIGDRTVFGWAYMVGGDYFALFGKRPAVGRWLTPEDDRPGAERVMVLSYPFWRHHFGADPGVVGRQVTVGGKFPYTVIGVAPRGFQGQGLAQNVYIPLAHWPDISHDLDNRAAPRITAFGRLRDGVSLNAAEEALAGLARGLDDAHPLDEPRRFALAHLSGFDAAPLDEGLGQRSKALMGVVGLLLVLASANVANLLLARAAGQRRDLAVRAALGAGRWQLIRRLAVEGVLLAGAGGILGSGLGWWASRTIEPMLYVVPVGMGSWGEGSRLFAFDHRMLGFSLLAALLTAVLFSLAPALELLRSDLVTPLKSDATGSVGGRGGRGRARGGPRRALVVVQVALGAVLLLAAGLLIRALGEIGGTDPGFSVDRLQLASLYLPGRETADDQERLAVYEGVRQRIAGIPGVEGASLIARPPLFGGSFAETIRLGAGAAVREPVTVNTNMADTGYFQVLGLPVVAGRSFRGSDRADGPGVVVVNRRFVERFYPGAAGSPAPGGGEAAAGRALGRRIELVQGRTPDEAGRSFEIVGVTADSRYADLATEPGPLVYFAVAQRPLKRMTVIVRTAGSASPSNDVLRRVVSGVRSDIAVIELAPLADQIRRSLAEQRLVAVVAGGTGAVALILAAVGLAALVAFSVSRRRREIAVRMALGARVRDAQGLLLRESAVLVGLGVVVGGAAGLALGKLIGSLLYGVAPFDPLTLLVVAVLLAVVALTAAFVPARRAARVDPARALRGE